MTLIAIDGPAGAGKTTLAKSLAEEISAHSTVFVIHMDDLYEGWDDPLNEDLTQRLKHLIHSHKSGNEIAFMKYNWKAMAFDDQELLLSTEVLIIEGVGAAQKIIRDEGAKTYWIDIDPEIGLQRVLLRDGLDTEPHMRVWQITQAKHFEMDRTRENCEFILT